MDFTGTEITGQPFAVTDDIDVFRNFSSPKINYSSDPVATSEYWIKPHSLLTEKAIHPQSITVFEMNGTKALFKTGGDFPFDIFAATFYLLSRYEEYLPHRKDIYGRYAHENSLAFRENFLAVPLVNQWLFSFKDSLQSKFPSLPIWERKFSFLPTYDIDEAFSYKYKGWFRTAGALFKAMLKGNWDKIAERRKVLKGEMQDPYDSYEWMDALHEQHQLHPRYFFLMAQQTGKYDRNILPDEAAFKSIVKQHAGKYDIGIHPSWQSGDKPELIKEEMGVLENLTSTKIISSRQHFIRLTLPQTFRYLVETGIKEDFSMGYGSINGFRASVASPFYWYDLEREEKTELLLYPFCYMDANSFFEQKNSAQQALEEMRQYYKTVKEVDGLLITLWHNTFLGTESLFKGWREAYEQFINEVTV
jgi:hypothetical protein